MQRRWLLMLSCVGALAACGGGDGEGAAGLPRAVPSSQSKAARELRLPVMRLAPSRASVSGSTGRTITVQVRIEGGVKGDSLVRSAGVGFVCGDSLVDTLVTRNRDAVIGALTWVEGPTAVVMPSGNAERRATVTVSECQLRPRLQVAPPGSTLQLVMRDGRAEALVIVPATPSLPIDTVQFLTDGQLVPVRDRADSTGVLAIYATSLPWARAFIAITPPGVSAVTDPDGVATFTLDPAGRSTTLRAWHPALGVVSATVDPSTLRAGEKVTLTFKP